MLFWIEDKINEHSTSIIDELLLFRESRRKQSPHSQPILRDEKASPNIKATYNNQTPTKKVPFLSITKTNFQQGPLYPKLKS